MKQKNSFALILVFFVLSLVLINASTAFTAGDPTVLPGTNPSAVNVGAVRYRSLKTLSDKEVYLGVPDLGVATNRTSLDLTWGATNNFTFVYDVTNDKLTTSVSNSAGSWTLEYPSFSSQVANLMFAGDASAADAVLDDLNYLDFTISLYGTGGAAYQLQNLFLDGNALGTYEAVHGSTLSWMITGYDFSAGFTLSGTLVLTGNFPSSADLNKIEIQFGHADTGPPTVSNVQADPNPVGFGKSVTLTALASDSLTGDSVITAAEYTYDDGVTWNPMSAADGVFDESSEDMTATFFASTVIDDYDLCVRAKDAGDNMSAESCNTLSVVDDESPVSSAVTANPNPVGFKDSLSLTALVDDSASGGSDIDSAEYSYDGGTTWYAMLPDDGAFDSPTEAVKADFSAPDSAGVYDLCVHGTDTAGNTGADSCVTFNVTDDQGPLVTSLLLTPNPATYGSQVVLTATVDDTSTGGSPIASAEYSQDGGSTWDFMDAVDGTIDAVSEQVTASFTASTELGTYSICVRGTDFATNLGTPVCVDLQVNETQGPVTSDVLLSPNPASLGAQIVLTATVEDTTSGGSTIASAEYSRDGGTDWFPLNAVDGTFDTVSEQVTASFTASTQPGTYSICVRGTDVVTNVGAPVCVDLLVNDTLGPISSNVLLTPNPTLGGELVSLTGQVSDATTGGSKIVSAQYSLNNGATWLSLQAQDGAFNSVTEQVSVIFAAPDQPGNYPICVRGKDSAGKTGAKTCVVLQVEGEPKMMKVWYFPIINRSTP